MCCRYDKNYLQREKPGENDLNAYIDVIREIEKNLANSEWMHNRIRLLEKCTAAGSSSENLEVVDDPLKREDYELIVKEGLVNTCKNASSGITVKQIRELTHSINGLRTFNDVLFKVPQEQHDRCWEGAFEVPFEIPRAELEKVLQHIPVHFVWQELTRLVNEWFALTFHDVSLSEQLIKESSSPGNRFTSLSKRTVEEHKVTGSVKSEASFIITKTFEEGEEIISQLKQLKHLEPETESDSVSESLQKIRWDKMMDSFSGLITWETFLMEFGRILGDDLNDGDISNIHEWIKNLHDVHHGHRSEIKLLQILMTSTHLHKASSFGDD